MAGHADVQGTAGGGRRRRDRHRRRRLPRHAGPPHRQAHAGRIFPRQRPRGDARLRLPARQRHRHGAGARLRRGQLGEGLWRLRHEARHGDAPPHAVAAGHGAGARRHPRPSPPRGRAARAARHPEEAGRAARGDEDVGLLRLGARVLSLRRDLRVGRRQGLRRPRRPPAATSRTTTSSRPPRKRG